MTKQVGEPGQFDVVVDGRTIASRTGGFFKKLLGAGWPDEADVVAKIRALAGAKTS